MVNREELRIAIEKELPYTRVVDIYLTPESAGTWVNMYFQVICLECSQSLKEPDFKKNKRKRYAWKDTNHEFHIGLLIADEVPFRIYKNEFIHDMQVEDPLCSYTLCRMRRMVLL